MVKKGKEGYKEVIKGCFEKYRAFKSRPKSFEKLISCSLISIDIKQKIFFKTSQRAGTTRRYYVEAGWPPKNQMNNPHSTYLYFLFAHQNKKEKLTFKNEPSPSGEWLIKNHEQSNNIYLQAQKDLRKISLRRTN